MRKRVLVCDGERHIVRLVEVNLKRQGYEVSFATAAHEAIEQLEKAEFDILVLDETMPGAEQIREWIQSHETEKQVAILPIPKWRQA